MGTRGVMLKLKENIILDSDETRKNQFAIVPYLGYTNVSVTCM